VNSGNVSIMRKIVLAAIGLMLSLTGLPGPGLGHRLAAGNRLAHLGDCNGCRTAPGEHYNASRIIQFKNLTH